MAEELHRIDWPHGDFDGTKAVCPDGQPCQHEVEWGRPCSRDVPYYPNEPENSGDPNGGSYMCERLPPPGGWE